MSDNAPADRHFVDARIAAGIGADPHLRVVFNGFEGLERLLSIEGGR